MLITTARPSVFAIARRAWASLIQAAPRLILLFIVTYALMVALDMAADRLTAYLQIPSHAVFKDLIKNNRRLPWLDVSKAMGRDVAVCVVRAFITAPLAVAMHRLILLGEKRAFPLLSGVTARFAMWLVLLQVPAMVLSWLILFAGAATGLVPLLTVLMAALLLFLMQTLQLLPAVAVEERSRDISARLETALERAEGMFWLTLAGLFLTFLPVIILQAIAVRAFAKLATHAPLIVPLGKATAGFIVVTLGASAVSWLYSYGAHKKAARADAAAGAGQPASPAS